jgi:hypothetical protein
MRTLVSAALLVVLQGGAFAQFEVGRLTGHDSATCVTSAYAQSVSVDVDTAIVGDSNSPCDYLNGGAAYVFRRVGGNWIEETKLTPTDLAPDAYFGVSVAVQGNYAYVCAPSGNPVFARPGAVYVFRRTGSFPFINWVQQAKLTASNAVPNDRFGHSVAVSGNTLAVLKITGSIATSEIYVFTGSGAAWVEQQRILPPQGSLHTVIALDGSTLAARRIATPSYNPVGVDIFDASGGLWTNTATLLSPAQFGADDFGHSIGLDSDRLIVAAPKADAVTVPQAGAFYFYRRTAGSWGGGTRIESTAPFQNWRFAQAVAIDGDFALAFADYHVPAGKPTIIAYDVSSGVPTQLGQMRAVAPDPLGSGSTSGSGLSLSGNTFVAAGAYAAVAFSLTPPPPVSYCTAKVSSAGCTPAMSFTGSASAASAAPFSLSASSIINNRFGLLFFGLTGRAAFPFQGGTLCVLPPTRRTLTQLSGGSPTGTNCTGSFTLDFNAVIQSGLEPGLSPGIRVNSQYWYRDPQSASSTGLTDAIEFGIGF